MLWSLESPNAGALVVPLAAAVLPHRFGQGRAVLPGSKNVANGQWGSPENLGGPVVSTGSFGTGEGVAEPKALPVRHPCVLGWRERMARRTAWYRQAKATKRGGRDGRKS